MDETRNASAAVVGAGDFIGAAIARRFAAGGYAVFAGRRNGEKLAPLVAEIEAAGGRCSRPHASTPARRRRSPSSWPRPTRAAPLEVCVFNVGANVNFPILETTERVFRKVWEMACYAGFLAGREAARLMLPRGRGTILFTGATASLRGGPGFAAFASAKFGLRAVAQSMARELGPKGIHVAHLVIDAGVDTAWVRERRRERGQDSFEPRRAVDPASSPRPTGSCTCSRATPGRTSWTSGPTGRGGEMDADRVPLRLRQPERLPRPPGHPGDRGRTGARFRYVPVLLGGVFKATGNRSPAEAFRRRPEQACLHGAGDASASSRGTASPTTATTRTSR